MKIRRFQLNNVRLRNKLLMLYFLSVFIPILLTNVIFYQVTTHNVQRQKTEDISLNLDKLKDEFRAKIDNAVGISSFFYTDGLLNDALEQTYAETIDYVRMYNSQLAANINKYNLVYSEIKGIQMYTNNPTIIDSGGLHPLTDIIRDSEWYRSLQKVHAEGQPYPLVMRSADNESSYSGLSIIRQMNNFVNANTYSKILKIEMSPDAIEVMFSNQALQGNLYLLNAEGDIQYTTDAKLDWIRGKTNFRSVAIPKDAIQLERTYSTNYLKNWRIVLVSDGHVLDAVRKSKQFVVYLALLNILLPTLVIVWISSSLHTRLVRILVHMKKVKNQHFDLIDEPETKDEIGQLVREFNRMTVQIKSLIDDVYIADIQKKDLELKQRQSQLHALQSQINPHFLFNALETIRMRSLIKQENETAKIIKNMAKMFRRSLEWGGEWVTFRDELDLILCFLEIQKYRFGDKLSYHFEVDESVYSCKIPKMTLLPFIENASLHGIEPLQGHGTIELKATRSGDQVSFTIADTGIGMPKEKVDLLNAYMGNGEDVSEHVGMKNAFMRLKLYYGNAIDVQISSEDGVGTIVKITTPVQVNESDRSPKLY
ncbi:sensor histidine kinase [Paenibacillus qinlingensis]|uniref:Two-component system sensor histidine kinase YesM n=1 Tax=Paenibacillus qinlingensis TaxID=1837343 RepID=A0ABU1P2F7_9BACL|nr:sensor histidine kinase [Paenibacillus qinlingensis]MDR6553536.1 two-component system sensor histidine kinase YesM [Paenibacillus qinlingensis]